MSNPFDERLVARNYEAWYSGPGRRAEQFEKTLLARMMAPFPPGSSVLEVGCGTGHFARWFAERGFRAVGLDVSPLMLDEAREHNGVKYVVGDASALPFENGSFDVVAFITSLEFVSDPCGALVEALRVARHGVLLGVLNRCSLLARRRKALHRAPWDSARFYSPLELTHLVRVCAGERLAKIRWRTTLWPIPAVGSLRLPWGGFIGMGVQLHPKPEG